MRIQVIPMTQEDIAIRVRVYGIRHWKQASRMTRDDRRDATSMSAYSRHAVDLTPSQRVRIDHLHAFGETI